MTANHDDYTGVSDISNDNEVTPLLRSNSQNSISAPKIPGWISCRHSLVILCFCGLFNVYAMRVNLSIAMVAMVDHVPKSNSTPIIGSECPGMLNSTEPKHKSTTETFDWDEKIQSQILGAFFYGYVITQIPGGLLAARFGGKWLFGIGVLCTSVFTLLTPLAAEAGEGWLFATRFLEGVGEGVTYPTFLALLANWAPPLERSILLTAIASGAPLGTIVANPLAGMLCESDFLGGWPSVFYTSGILGIVWFIFWILLAFDSPAEHPRISIEEKEYIEKSIGHIQTNSSSSTFHIPVFSIFTSLPVWGIITACFTSNWLFYTLLTNLPNYLENILKFDISQSGFLTALPSVFSCTSTLLGGQIADFMRRQRYLTTRQTRNLFNTLGQLIAGVAIVMVGYVGCNKVLAMVFLCTCYIGFGLLTAGYSTNMLDIAPRYASFIMGIVNTAGSIPGFVGPYVVGVFTEGNNTRQQWEIVFWISTGLQVVGSVMFLLTSSGEEQAWAKDSGKSKRLNVSDNDYDTSSLLDNEHSINPDMAAR